MLLYGWLQRRGELLHAVCCWAEEVERRRGRKERACRVVLNIMMNVFLDECSSMKRV
jgi:hypothetical protein